MYWNGTLKDRMDTRIYAFHRNDESWCEQFVHTTLGRALVKRSRTFQWEAQTQYKILQSWLPSYYRHSLLNPTESFCISLLLSRLPKLPNQSYSGGPANLGNLDYNEDIQWYYASTGTSTLIPSLCFTWTMLRWYDSPHDEIQRVSFLLY